MKKFALLLAGVALVGFSLTSCHKMHDCKCTTTYTTAGVDPDVDYYSGKGNDNACWQGDANLYDDKGAKVGERKCENM